MNRLKNTFLGIRFFMLAGVSTLLFCISFFVPVLFWISVFFSASLFVLLVLDWIIIHANKTPLSVERSMGSLFSLGDDNKVEIIVRNLGKNKLRLEIIDELPVQLQVRDFSLWADLSPFETKVLHYKIQPKERGEYIFGHLNVMIYGFLHLAQRRIQLSPGDKVKVYPSIIQMRNMELYTSSKLARIHGIKKLRRIGVSYEFEQIKTYVQGDDIRQINWKASGKHSQLMVNQHEDERSQPIYNIIDKSRNMLMPFNGLSLMDYAINTSLVMTNVALRKSDKAGLITFSNKFGSVIKADNSHNQLKNILEALYNQKERNYEADFELLYQGIRNMIKTRSLLMLYTNFESLYGLQRALPVLRKINQQHLLLVIVFENNELRQLAQSQSGSLKDAYIRIMAEQAITEKSTIVQELNNVGIQAILSQPEDLSVNTVNKYLEIKSRGLV